MRTCVIFLMLLISIVAQAKDIKEIRESLGLGNAQFAPPCKDDDANEHFLLGISFLQSFMDDLALQQFQEAKKLEPHCAMASWGEAMASQKPVEVNVGDQALPEKEALYIAAIPLINQDTAYVNHMRDFYKKFPNDPNVAAFYVLALMGPMGDFPQNKSTPEGIKEGRFLVDQLYKTFPQHPGIVHYYLHYHNTPDRETVEQALPAAKTVIDSLYSSSHMDHLASAIYRKLQRWDEYIDANELAVQASYELCKLLDDKPYYACDADNKYNAMEWLQDGYLKKSNLKEAKKLVKNIEKVVENDPNPKYKEWYYRMWGRQTIAAHDWHVEPIDIQAIAQPGENLAMSAYSECGALIASGLLLANQGQPVDEIISRFDTIIEETSKLPDSYVMQSCKIARLKVLVAQARVQDDKVKSNDYTRQALEAQSKRIATSRTPTLDILP